VHYETTVPCVSDRALQRSVSEVLSSIYEQDFLACSFGGRPRLGAHNALSTLNDRLITQAIQQILGPIIMQGGTVSIREAGTAQGSPLSPLLSNILLDDLDRELERRGHHFCRYADDTNVYVRSQRAGVRVMASLKDTGDYS